MLSWLYWCLVIIILTIIIGIGIVGVVVSACGDTCIVALFHFYSYLISRSGKYYGLSGN